MNTIVHSDQFIQEMKHKLEAEKTQLQKELSSLSRKDHEDYQANFPEYGRNEEENVTEVADFQARFATTETIESRLRDVEKALQRIQEGTYGATEDGEKIPEERLRANPAATTLVSPSK